MDELTEENLRDAEEWINSLKPHDVMTIQGNLCRGLLRYMAEIRRLRAENDRLRQEPGNRVASEIIDHWLTDAGKEKPDLEGEIKVGDRFIWEPDSSAFERIVVTQVKVNGDGLTWIESANEQGERHWNDESRFREACIRPIDSGES